MAKLRYLQTYDENGLDSECTLQYWDDDSNAWQDVSLVRVPESKGRSYQNNEYV